MPTDAERRDLFVALESSLGPGPASTLMSLLPPIDWAEIARRADIEAQGAALRGEIAELRGELRGEIGVLSGRVDALSARVDGMSGRLDGMSGRLDGVLGRQLLADIPLAFAVAGLVLAAVKLG